MFVLLQFILKTTQWGYFLNQNNFFLIFILFWSIVDEQGSVSFMCRAEWFSYTYISIFFKLFSPLDAIIHFWAECLMLYSSKSKYFYKMNIFPKWKYISKWKYFNCCRPVCYVRWWENMWLKKSTCLCQ